MKFYPISIWVTKLTFSLINIWFPIHLYGTMIHTEVGFMEKKRKFEVGICYVFLTVKEIKSVPIVWKILISSILFFYVSISYVRQHSDIDLLLTNAFVFICWIIIVQSIINVSSQFILKVELFIFNIWLFYILPLNWKAVGVDCYEKPIIYTRQNKFMDDFLIGRPFKLKKKQ